jgi:hypothetical protein
MKFQIDYLDTEGELSHYWTDALTQEEAERNLYDDMWDVDVILTIRQK